MNEIAESAEIMAAVPLKPLLKELKSQNIKLGVATNDGISPARAHLKSAEILNFFDSVLSIEHCIVSAIKKCSGR